MRSRIALQVVVTSLALAACGGPVAETTTTAGVAASTTTAPADPAGVSVMDSSLGSILVDPGGRTVYVFTPDNGGDSTCYDECAALWPPIPGETPTGPEVDGAMFGTTTRTDGTSQLTVNGWPLYLYTLDGTPGEVNGQGVEGVWFVVDESGEIVGPSSGGSGGSDTTDPDYDYGY